MYAITAQIETKDGNWTGSRQVPTFYVTGVTTEESARRLAIEIIDPGGFAQLSGKLTAIHVTAAEILITIDGKENVRDIQS
jgi:hypothetical protein